MNKKLLCVLFITLSSFALSAQENSSKEEEFFEEKMEFDPEMDFSYLFDEEESIPGISEEEEDLFKDLSEEEKRMFAYPQSAYPFQAPSEESNDFQEAAPTEERPDAFKKFIKEKIEPSLEKDIAEKVSPEQINLYYQDIPSPTPLETATDAARSLFSTAETINKSSLLKKALGSAYFLYRKIGSLFYRHLVTADYYYRANAGKLPFTALGTKEAEAFREAEGITSWLPTDMLASASNTPFYSQPLRFIDSSVRLGGAAFFFLLDLQTIMKEIEVRSKISPDSVIREGAHLISLPFRRMQHLLSSDNQMLHPVSFFSEAALRLVPAALWASFFSPDSHKPLLSNKFFKAELGYFGGEQLVSVLTPKVSDFLREKIGKDTLSKVEKATGGIASLSHLPFISELLYRYAIVNYIYTDKSTYFGVSEKQAARAPSLLSFIGYELMRAGIIKASDYLLKSAARWSVRGGIVQGIYNLFHLGGAGVAKVGITKSNPVAAPGDFLENMARSWELIQPGQSLEDLFNKMAYLFPNEYVRAISSCITSHDMVKQGLDPEKVGEKIALLEGLRPMDIFSGMLLSKYIGASADQYKMLAQLMRQQGGGEVSEDLVMRILSIPEVVETLQEISSSQKKQVMKHFFNEIIISLFFSEDRGGFSFFFDRYAGNATQKSILPALKPILPNDLVIA